MATIDLLQRRRQMMAKKRVVNLLDDADQPHGYYTRPTQLLIAIYKINDTIEQGERIHFKIEFDFLDENKTEVQIYNTSSRAAARLGVFSISNGKAEGEFDWIEYDANNLLRVYTYPNGDDHQISTVKLAQLYRL